YDICEHLNLGSKIFTSVMDLELTYLFMMKDVMKAGGVWNQRFSKGKLEGGSILDDYGKFRGKVDILEGFTSFTYRCRAFWDKYMGLLVLIYSPDDYEKYCSAKSRKNKFRTICSKWENFSPEIQKSLITALQMHSDPLYRGAASVAATKCNKQSAAPKIPKIGGGFISSAYVFWGSFFHRVGNASRKAIAKS
ncbi:MAG: hypothetical protein WBA76_07055, partial [Phormidesmis sp.]